MLERKDHEAIVRIQKSFRNWKAKRHAIEQRAWAADLLRGKKERRRASVDIKYTGDYLNVETNPGIMEAMQEHSMCFPPLFDLFLLLTVHCRKGKNCVR